MAIGKKNIFLNNTNSTFDYVSPKRMGGLSIPQRPNFKSHGEFIQ
ncbi:hypothetical protein ACWOB8_06130 [Enterococcus ratti]|uniref:Uncharacterized protein n=1 Tax=Enterococcus ratti TaxID=150033 RepID=A0A1L8WR88_9ENTE|nr:hypothetical protein RV14_GL001417 [Enterococcus ratti]